MLTSLNFWLCASRLVMVVLATTWLLLPDKLIRLSDGGDNILWSLRLLLPISPSIDVASLEEFVMAPFPVGTVTTARIESKYYFIERIENNSWSSNPIPDGEGPYGPTDLKFFCHSNSDRARLTKTYDFVPWYVGVYWWKNYFICFWSFWKIKTRKNFAT